MRVPQIRLGPLGSDEAAAMLHEILGRAPSATVTSELLRLSDGSPFALEELTRAAFEGGWLDPVSGDRRADTPIAIPWTLTESIRARASRLAPGERELLRWAAIIGHQFDVRLLVEAAGTSHEAALSALHECVAVGLLAEDRGDPQGNSFMFRHALVHEALAQEQLLAERVRQHAAVIAAAERLAEHGTDVTAGDLARHALAAGDRARIVRYAPQAARDAESAGASEDAQSWLDLALGHWRASDGAALRAELQQQLGLHLVSRSLGSNRSIDLLTEARRTWQDLGEGSPAAECLSALAQARFTSGQRDQAFRDWRIAIEELQKHAKPERTAAALAELARALGWDRRLSAARATAAEALGLVPQITTREQAGIHMHVLVTLGNIEMERHRYDAGRDLLTQALRIAENIHDDLGAAQVHNVLGMHSRSTSDSIAHFDRSAELARRHGWDELELFHRIGAAWPMIDLGDVAGAQHLVDDVEEVMRLQGRKPMLTLAAVHGARAYGAIAIGDFERAHAEIDAVLEIADERTHPAIADEWLVRRAGVLLVQGQPVEAHGRVRRYVDDVLISLDDAAVGKHGSDDVLEMFCWLIVIQILVANAAFDDARAIVTMLQTYVPEPWFAYADALARLDQVPPEESAARIQETIEVLELLGRPLGAARLSAIASSLIASRPDGRDAALQLGGASHRCMTALGATGWCDWLVERLPGADASSHPESKPPGALTPRELEVVQLIGAGLTNRQIAARLVISESTAIRHVANIYLKLGVHNRVSAVRVAGDQGLITPE